MSKVTIEIECNLFFHLQRLFLKNCFFQTMKVIGVQNDTGPHWLSFYGQKKTDNKTEIFSIYLIALQVW